MEEQIRQVDENYIHKKVVASDYVQRNNSMRTLAFFSISGAILVYSTTVYMERLGMAVTICLALIMAFFIWKIEKDSARLKKEYIE